MTLIGGAVLALRGYSASSTGCQVDAATLRIVIVVAVGAGAVLMSRVVPVRDAQYSVVCQLELTKKYNKQYGYIHDCGDEPLNNIMVVRLQVNSFGTINNHVELVLLSFL